MALTPRKISSDTEYTSAWAGTEYFPVIVDIGSGVYRNRKVKIGNVQKLVSSAFSSLPAASAGNAGQLRRVTDLAIGEAVVMSTGSAWVIVGNRVYDLGLFVPGVPDTSSNQTLQKIVIIRPTTIPADMAGAVGHCDTNPDSQYDIDVQVDAVSIGTISVATNGTVTFDTSGSAVNVDEGSVLEFLGPSSSPAEASLYNLAVTIPVVLRTAT